MNRLHSKSFIVTQFLANYFLSIDIGNRIKTISELLDDIDVSRGTIQNGLQVLKESNAVKLSPRGLLGTFLERKNTGVLLKYADIHFIVGVMPLPYTKLYEGLSNGIIDEMVKTIEIPVNMAYMRGASKRIEMVCQGRYDFTIVSKFAANNYMDNNPNTITIVKSFGVGSYLKGHSLVLRNPNYNRIEDGMRVAVDYDSIDQYKLTIKACENRDVIFVPMSYSKFTSSLFLDKIDAMIWNTDEISRTLSEYKTVEIEIESLENTEAVIVIDSHRPEIAKLIEEGINTESVLKSQSEVVEGIRTPQY